MGSEWEEYSLTDLYSVRSGLSKPAKDFGEGYPFLSFKDVFDNYFLPDELAQKVKSNDREREGCSIQRGDVFLTRTSETMDDLGMSSVARKSYPDATFNGFCKRLRPKTNTEIYPEYVGYFLRSPKFRNEMLAFSTMSTRASLNNDMISRLSIKLPPLPEQKAIAHILGSLDDKIELNRRMNETLEGMAQALFKSWFIDFDPVLDNAILAGNPIPEAFAERAKIRRAILDKNQPSPNLSQGERDRKGSSLEAGNPIPEELTERADVRRQALASGTANREIAKQFPAAFQFTEELGWIPEGWEVSKIEDLAERVAMGPFGSSIKVSTFVEEGVPVVSGQHLNNTLLEDSEFNYVTPEHAEKLKRSNVYPGDIIFTHAGNIGQVSLIPPRAKFDRYVISQRQFYLRCDEEKTCSIYLTYFFRSHNGQHVLLANSSQVGVPSLARPSSYLKSIEVINPPKTIRSLFNQLGLNIHSSIASNILQSGNLTKLRNTLLPKLISGELRIPEAEKLAKEVLG